MLWLLEKGVFNKNITRALQVAMASLNGKSTEDSSSNEADIQELAEDEIQESVEDAQETVKGGVQEAIYQRSAGGRSSDTNLITC